MMNYSNGGYNYNPYYPQPQQMTPQVNSIQTYKIIPISNKNDTNAAIADFNGTPIYFHNQSNNEIYIKQFDVKTGVTTLQEFKRVESPLSDDKDTNNVNIYKNDFQSLNDKIDSLQKTFDDYIKLQEENKTEDFKKVSKK